VGTAENVTVHAAVPTIIQPSPKWINAAITWVGMLEGSRSAKTLLSIQSKLVPFLETFGNEPPGALTYVRFEEWFSSLNDSRNLLSTMARYRHEALRLVKTQNPMLAEQLTLNQIKVPKSKIVTLTDKEYLAVKLWVENNIGSDIMKRARLAAYLSVIATSGMRSAECCALDWAAWDPDALMFHVTSAKTQVSRFAVVHGWTKDMLSVWQSSKFCSPTVVVPRSGDPWAGAATPDTMRKQMTMLKVETGITHVNSKCFRSTLVKRVIESGGSYEDAASIVGHTSTTTTSRIYNRIAMNDQAVGAHSSALKGIMG
jgi:integrase